MSFNRLVSVALFTLSLSNALEIPVVNGVIGGIDRSAQPQATIVQPDVVTTPGKLRNVVENSGICASGYADIALDKSIFFWYFAARQSPTTAPLTLWLNGGPGSSSMFGLFQENGPCRITNDSTGVSHNQWSWNGAANMLYIDQPVGVGFSHGNTTVNTTRAAAEDVWEFMQIFLNDARFRNLISNKLAIWTESYGGHYGPAFAAYFLEQNQAISIGAVDAILLNLEVLGIGNGLTDPITQYPAYITYANSNPYHVPLAPTSAISNAAAAWAQPTAGCRDRIVACNSAGATDLICQSAQSFCNGAILTPLSSNWNPDYVISPVGVNSIASQIGAETTWVSTNSEVYNGFALTGDWVRTSIHNLETVINAGVRVTVYDGDADFLCNYVGVEAMLTALNTQVSAAFNAVPLSTYAPISGIPAGLYKTAGKLSYARIYGAGHEVPAYKYGPFQFGQVAWYVFSTTMEGQSLFST
ncbi:serine carboxypeptidase [Mycena amicta]|nr:serine carboxypeptidase [Mycena amicta]